MATFPCRWPVRMSPSLGFGVSPLYQTGSDLLYINAINLLLKGISNL